MATQHGTFPATRASVVRALGSDDRGTRHRAHDALARMYWKPVYKYIRLRWNSEREAAEDLTQDFFGQAFANEWFCDFDAARARFRSFLRICVDRCVMNAQRSANRQKRGGGVTVVPMDFAVAENELVLPFAETMTMDPDELFRREWVRSVFETAVARLREDLVARHKAMHFELFTWYDLHGEDGARPTYAALATAFAIPVSQVTNYLALARRRFREVVLELLADTTGDERDYADSVRELLGVSP